MIDAARLMEATNEPKRVVLRFHVQHELEEAAISEQFFALYGPKPPDDDMYSHLTAPNESSQMHIVLDIHCKSFPTIDNSKIAYQVFRVKKKGELFVAPSPADARTNCESVHSNSSTNLRANMLAHGARGSNGELTDPPNLRNCLAPSARRTFSGYLRTLNIKVQRQVP